MGYFLNKLNVFIPIPTGMTDSDGPMHPSIVDMTGVSGFTYNYAIYASTDHSATTGGIWGWGSDDLVTWTELNSGNSLFVDSTQGNSTETPCVQNVDGTLYMTYHQNSLSSGATQQTLMATSTNGTTFTRLNGASDSIVLPHNNTTDLGAPLGHTGNFRWGRNPGFDLPYTWIGYGLQRSTDSFLMAQWGTNDLDGTWTRLATFSHGVGRFSGVLPSNWVIKWSQLDVGSFKPAGNGEFIGLITAGEVGAFTSSRRDQIYEVYVDSLGRRINREPRLIIPLGGTGDKDSDQGTMHSTLDLGGGDHVTVYTAVDGDSKNTIGVAKGTYVVTSVRSKGLEPDITPNTTYFWDARVATGLPQWLEKNGSGTLSFSSDGITIPTDAGVMLTDTIDPSDYDMIEIVVTENTKGSNSTRIPRIQIGAATVGTVPDGLVAFTSNSETGFVRLSIKQTGESDIVTDDDIYDWGYNDATTRGAHTVGLRYFPRLQKCYVVAGSVEQEILESAAISDSIVPSASRLQVGPSASATWGPIATIKMTLRKQNPPKTTTGQNLRVPRI